MKISLVEGSRRCRLVVEGELIAPWIAAFTTECQKAIDNLHGRELIIDLRSVSSIGPEAERVLLQLMRQKVKFKCGVFMKEFLKQLARKGRTEQWLGEDDPPGEDPDGGKTV